MEWVAVDARHRLRAGMFVAQVVGKSMEPAIPDGAYCLFAAPVEGSRQGKTVLLQLHGQTDLEHERFTVKNYFSEGHLGGRLVAPRTNHAAAGQSRLPPDRVND